MLRGISSSLHRHPGCGSRCCWRCRCWCWWWCTSARSPSLLLSAFWSTDVFTGDVVRSFTLDNFREVISSDIYRTVILRTHRRGRRGDRDRRGARVPDGVLHGEGGFAPGPAAAGGRRAHPAVGELSGQGVRVAGMLADDGVVDWSLEPFGLRGPGYGLTATVIVLSVPVAAVHGAADLRRAGTAAGLAAGGLRRPRRQGGRTFRSVVLPLVVPGGRRRVDLHLLAVAWATTSRCRSSAARRSCSATWSTPTSAQRTTCRSRRRWPPYPVVIMIVYPVRGPPHRRAGQPVTLSRGARAGAARP